MSITIAPILPSITDIRARKEPALQWRWLVVIPSISGIVSNAQSLGQTIHTPNISQIYTNYIEDISFPHIIAPAHSRFIEGGHVYFPEAKNIQHASITFYEDYSYLTTNYLYTWKSLVVDVNGNYGIPGEPSDVDGSSNGYKQPINLFTYDVTGKCNFQAILAGCFPTGISSATYTQHNDRLIVSCEFSVDFSILVSS